MSRIQVRRVTSIRELSRSLCSACSMFLSLWTAKEATAATLYLLSSVSYSRPYHFIFLDLITILLFGEEQKLCNLSTCNFSLCILFYAPGTSSLISPKVISQTSSAEVLPSWETKFRNQKFEEVSNIPLDASCLNLFCINSLKPCGYYIYLQFSNLSFKYYLAEVHDSEG